MRLDAATGKNKSSLLRTASDHTKDPPGVVRGGARKSKSPTSDQDGTDDESRVRRTSSEPSPGQSRQQRVSVMAEEVPLNPVSSQEGSSEADAGPSAEQLALAEARRLNGSAIMPMLGGLGIQPADKHMEEGWL